MICLEYYSNSDVFFYLQAPWKLIGFQVFPELPDELTSTLNRGTEMFSSIAAGTPWADLAKGFGTNPAAQRLRSETIANIESLVDEIAIWVSASPKDRPLLKEYTNWGHVLCSSSVLPFPDTSDLYQMIYSCHLEWAQSCTDSYTKRLIRRSKHTIVTCNLNCTFFCRKKRVRFTFMLSYPVLFALWRVKGPFSYWASNRLTYSVQQNEGSKIVSLFTGRGCSFTLLSPHVSSPLSIANTNKLTLGFSRLL